jgi:type II secretory pathway pseudopilin PulG
MTLIEMIVALTIFSFIMAGALSMLRSESKRFQLGGERAAMYQNGRFAMNEMEKDLRTSGAGAPDVQPQMVYIADSVIVFNANYWTNTPGDVEAVYYVSTAPDSAVQAMRTTGKVTIPFTAIQYPDTNYLVGGVNSSAETITFWFARDSSTPRTDDFVLWRRINNLAPEVVSTNLLQTSGEPFFRYFRLTSTGTSQSLDTVARASLPWRHTRPIHLAANDTGTAARIDSIRAIRVSFTVTNGRSGDDEQVRSISRLIRLPNVGIANTKTCGDAPIFGATINIVAAVDAADSTRYVRLSFLPSVDENSGERDVERYVIFRRFGSVADWGDPLATIPGGDTLYIYNDVTVIKDSTYRFAVAAQDCTPSLSGLRETSTVTIP